MQYTTVYLYCFINKQEMRVRSWVLSEVMIKVCGNREKNGRGSKTQEASFFLLCIRMTIRDRSLFTGDRVEMRPNIFVH